MTPTTYQTLEEILKMYKNSQVWTKSSGEYLSDVYVSFEMGDLLHYHLDINGAQVSFEIIKHRLYDWEKAKVKSNDSP